jgi:hypothetical protein
MRVGAGLLVGSKVGDGVGIGLLVGSKVGDGVRVGAGLLVGNGVGMRVGFWVYGCVNPTSSMAISPVKDDPLVAKKRTCVLFPSPIGMEADCHAVPWSPLFLHHVSQLVPPSSDVSTVRLPIAAPYML